MVRPEHTTALPASALVLWELGGEKERQSRVVTGSLEVSWVCFANHFRKVSWAILHWICAQRGKLGHELSFQLEGFLLR